MLLKGLKVCDSSSDSDVEDKIINDEKLVRKEENKEAKIMKRKSPSSIINNNLYNICGLFIINHLFDEFFQIFGIIEVNLNFKKIKLATKNLEDSDSSSSSSYSKSSSKSGEKKSSNKHISKKSKKKHKRKKKEDFAEILLKEKLQQAKAESANINNSDSKNFSNRENDKSTFNENSLLNKKRLQSQNEGDKAVQDIDLEKLNFILSKDEIIKQENSEKKHRIDSLIDDLFALFKTGNNEEFQNKFKQLENLGKTKNNFIEKIKVKDSKAIDSNTLKTENKSSDMPSDSDEGDVEQIGDSDLKNFNFDDANSTNMYAYDKNREFLNTDINIKLKSDLLLMNKFNDFEKGLNMDKNFIDYSNSLSKNALAGEVFDDEKNNSEQIDNAVFKQQKQMLGILFFFFINIYPIIIYFFRCL